MTNFGRRANYLCIVYISFLFEMVKYIIVHFAIIFLMCFPEIFPNDFYSKFYQNDYTFDFQRLEVVDYNKSVLNVLEVKTFKYNRTMAVINGTINSKINISTELEVAVQSYKFLSNEYRKLFGTNFQINYCRSIRANIWGLEMLFKQGNFSPTCQIVQETTYKVWNAYPDQSRFPPLIPNGEYKMQIDFLYRNQIIGTLAGYKKIYRPIAIPGKQ